MQNQVQTQNQQSNLPAVDMAAWGAPAPMTAQDLILAKVLPMQMMSKKVIDQQASFGEYRDSINNQKLGDFTQEMDFIPFHMEKTFVEFEVQGTKKVYKRIVPIISDATNPGYNEEAPYEETVEGKKISRDRMLSFYVLPASQINPALADTGGGVVPMIIGFRRTSIRGGKKVATQMYVTNAAARKAPAASVMVLTAVKTTNDHGTFVVQDTKFKREATPEELKAAFYWFQQVRKGGTKVDHSDLQEETETAVTEPTEF